MDAPLELQDEVLQLDARQFNYRVVHGKKEGNLNKVSRYGNILIGIFCMSFKMYRKFREERKKQL